MFTARTKEAAQRFIKPSYILDNGKFKLPQVFSEVDSEAIIEFACLPYVVNTGGVVGYAVCVPSKVLEEYSKALAGLTDPSSLAPLGYDLTNDSLWLRTQGTSPSTEV